MMRRCCQACMVDCCSLLGGCIEDVRLELRSMGMTDDAIQPCRSAGSDRAGGGLLCQGVCQSNVISMLNDDSQVDMHHLTVYGHTRQSV